MTIYYDHQTVSKFTPMGRRRSGAVAAAVPAARDWRQVAGFIACVAVVAVITTVTAAAQAPASPATWPDGQIASRDAGTIELSHLIGAPATSPDGKVLGEVTDILMTPDNRVQGVVLGVGGFLGFGDKAVAIDMSRVVIARGPQGGPALGVVVHYTLDDLETAPEFVSQAGHASAPVTQ